MTTLHEDLKALRQALKPIPCDGPGGPDGYGIEDWEIDEWNLSFREACDPARIARLLAAVETTRDALAELTFLASSAFDEVPYGRGEQSDEYRTRVAEANAALAQFEEKTNG